MIKKLCFLLLLSLTPCTFAGAFLIRHATANDIPALVTFYKHIAQQNNGLAKTPQEITTEYVTDIVTRKTNNGFCLVVKDHNKQMHGVIHTQRLEPQGLSQTLGETTLLINPELHGKGIDEQLVTSSMRVIQESYHDILRFEAVVRESDQRSLNLYTSAGFKQEGRLVKKDGNNNGDLEAAVVMVWFRPKTVLRSKI